MWTNVQTWIEQNPYLFYAVVWPFFAALVSLVFKSLGAKYPRLHAIGDMMVAVGFDLPKLLDAFQRALTRQPMPIVLPPPEEPKP